MNEQEPNQSFCPSPFIPVASVQDIPKYNPQLDLVCGFMSKNDNNAKQSWCNLSCWKRRWFWISLDIDVQGNYILSYANREAKENYRPKRSFHLVGATIIVHSARIFSLQFSNFAVNLRCDTDQDAFHWTSSLAHIIAVADIRAEILSKINIFIDSDDLSSRFLRPTTIKLGEEDEGSAMNSLNSSLDTSTSDSDSAKSSTASEHLRKFDTDRMFVAQGGEFSTDSNILASRSRSRSFHEASLRNGNTILAREYQEKRDNIVIVSSPNELWLRTHGDSPSLLSTNVSYNQSHSEKARNIVSIACTGIMYSIELLCSFFCLNIVLFVMVGCGLVLALLLFWCNLGIYFILLLWKMISFYPDKTPLP